MSEMHFTEDDKQKIVEFLNLVATHARFDMNTSELIQYFRSLSYMQQKLLAKVDANLFEVKRIVEPSAPVEEPKKRGKG